MAYLPDYGLRLLRDGTSASADLIFHDFRLFTLDVVGPGEYTTLVQQQYEGEMHALSLDFNHEQLERILSSAEPGLAAAIRTDLARDPALPRRINFQGQVPFAVRARLGQLQTAAKEQYVPLLAQEIPRNDQAGRAAISIVIPRTWVPGTPRGYGDSKTAAAWVRDIESALTRYRDAARGRDPDSTRYAVTLEFRLRPGSPLFGSQNPGHGTDLDNLAKQTIDGLTRTRGGDLPAGLNAITNDNAIYRLTLSKEHVASDEEMGVFVTVEVL